MKNFDTVIGQDLAAAVKYLRADEVIGIPTETVYGLAGNALSKTAVSKIFQVKNRPTFNPLIVHIADASEVTKYAMINSPLAERLMAHFWPGPLTLLLPKKANVPDLVTAGSNLVAIRVPNHPLTLALLQKVDFPIAAPSANPFMYVSPTSAQHVMSQLGGKIPYILDGGKATVGLESTIIGFDGDQAVVYRVGGISVEAIEAVIGPVKIHQKHSAEMDVSAQIAPGQMMKHYATGKPAHFEDTYPTQLVSQQNKVGILCFNQVPDQIKGLNISKTYILSPNNDLNEAASQLFEVMRLLDEDDEVEVIIYVRFPEDGLGRAINDRLNRAVTP